MKQSPDERDLGRRFGHLAGTSGGFEARGERPGLLLASSVSPLDKCRVSRQTTLHRVVARQRAFDVGAARGRAILATLCRELDAARLEHGLAYADIGRAVGLSGEQVARICRGESRSLSIVRASILCSVLGRDLSARSYPAGPPIRDAAHVALLGRLRDRIGGETRWIAEAPVVTSSVGEPGKPIDRRAWDVILAGDAGRVAVEAETRLGDVQSLLRRLALKQRDGDVDAVVLLVSDTAHNRRLIADPTIGIREQFPGSARLALGRLASGRPLDCNALVVL